MTRKIIILLVACIASFFVFEEYYRYMFDQRLHINALRKFGVAAYWLALIGPSICLAIGLSIVFRIFGKGGAKFSILGAIVVSFGVGFFSLFGESIICILSGGSCK